MTKFLLLLILSLLVNHCIYSQEQGSISPTIGNIPSSSKTKSNSSNESFENFYQLGEDFFVKGDMAFSLFYFSKSALQAIENKNLKDLPAILVNVCEIWNKLYYIKRSSNLLFTILPLANIYKDYKTISRIHMAIAYNYHISYEYDLAIERANESIEFALKSNDPNTILKILLDLIEIHLNNKNYASAKLHLDDAIAWSQKSDNIHLITRAKICYANSILDSQPNIAKQIIDEIKSKPYSLSKENEIDLILLEAKLDFINTNYSASISLIKEILAPLEKLQWQEKRLIALEVFFKCKSATFAYNTLDTNIQLLNKIIMNITSLYNTEHIKHSKEKHNTAYLEKTIEANKLEIEKKRLQILYYILIIILLCTIAPIIIYFVKRNYKRAKLQQENERLQFEQTKSALQLNNYNKQLDPHEIKNLISSLAPHLQRKAPSIYKKMIKLFNITRASLNNGFYEPLSIQLQQMEDLINLHQNSNDDNINYEIHMHSDAELNPNLPRLILKNIAESILKHNYTNGNTKKHIKVDIKHNEQYSQINIKATIIAETQEKLIYNPSNAILNTYQKTFGFLNQHNQLKATLEFEQIDNSFLFFLTIPNNYTYPS